MFSLRIVATDHYLCPPIPELDVRYSDLTQSEIWRVPVIRVYGSTPSGQKTCMHVHGVFPYLYVPYDGTQPWDRYLKLFARSLDKALNVSLNKVNSNTQHVYKINLVSGIPMYGYHEKEEQFLKIFLYNPRMVKKAADLLLGGAVMNKAFQPHEAHIPYILQMFIDYNLYGMNMINVCAVKFRKQKTDDGESCYLPYESYNRMQKKKESEELSPSTPTTLFDRTEIVTHKTWDINNIQEELLLDESITRQSTCELECDVVAPDILNRQDVDDKIGINPGLAALWEDEKQRKRNMGETSQITPPDSQEREDIEMSESDKMLRLKYLQIIQDQKPYIDSQTTDESQGSVRDNSQASVLDMQLSEEGLESSSLDTVIVEDDEMIPIISVDSIKRVVSMSQSFSASQPSLANSQDKSLADILASLAEENCSSSSQETAQQITALEERDSILLEKSQPIDDEDVKQQDEETLEMTQVVFDDVDKNKDTINQQEEMILPEARSADFNLEGLDDTWNMSQFIGGDGEDETDDDIPQFDGVGDELGKETKTEKNLQKPFVSNQVPTAGNMENNSDSPSLGSNSQNENTDQISSQSQNETIPATVSYRKRYREDNSVYSGHGFDNFGNIVSSHQTGNDIHKGNVNLHSINQMNSSQSRLGNNGNYSKILHTSAHDSNRRCKQSTVHSSQMPTSNPGSCIKSPVHEDNLGINAQSLFRMSPSPEKDNFTVHHYSQDSLQGNKEIGSVQEQMLQSNNNYHRNMPSLNDLLRQSHFHMSNVNPYDNIKGHSSQYPATSNVQSVSQPVVNKLLQTGYQVNSGSQKTLPGSHYNGSQNGNHQMPHTPSYKIGQEQQQMQKSSENNLFTPVNLQTLLLPKSYQHAQSGSIVPSLITEEHLTNCNNQNNQSDQRFSATNALVNMPTSQVLPMNDQLKVQNIQYTLPVSSNGQFYMQSHRNSFDNLHEYSHRNMKQTSSTVRNVSSRLTHQHSGRNVSSSLTHQHSGSNVSSSNLTHQHSRSNVSSSSLTHQHSGSNVSSSSLTHQHSRSNVSSSSLTQQHSGSNVNHFQEKSFHQLLTEDEHLSKQDNSEDGICFKNSQLSENTTNYKSKPYTELIPKCHQYIGQSSNEHSCLPSNNIHVEQNRRQKKNLTEFNQTSSFHPVESKDQSINNSLQRSITEDLKKKQDMSVIHQTHKAPHNIGYLYKHSGMQPMQQNPKAKEISRSTNIRQKLQRIPSASTIMPSMHENIKKKATMKNEGKSCKNFHSKNEPSTLERLLLYGNDDTIMGSSCNKTDNASEVYVQSTNESTDQFLHSSQLSSTQRALSQPQTHCESSVRMDKTQGSERKNTLSSLETLVKNVNHESSFGYHYKSPVHSQDLNNFDPFSVSDTNSVCNTSESSSYSWQKSPAHNDDTESSSDFSHPKLSCLYDGSKSPNQFCVYKSPSQFGGKPPNHVGLGRSLSYSGSLHYDNFNSNTLKEQNKMHLHEKYQHPLDLNHTWSESSKNVKKQKAAIKRSNSFTFEKKVQQGTRTNSIQQMKQHCGVKSKKPLTPNRAYSFTFHLPTPFYKKLKFKNEKELKHDISVVRMHPMDARRYSLLKIGRGIVKVKKLSQTDIDKSGIKASLEELLRKAENNQKQKSLFYQKCVQNYKMKSPYDIKTQDVKFVNEINVSNKKDNLISKKHKSLVNMANIYREPMIAPPAQTLSASSKDCHSIQKVTLTSIIENALLTTVIQDNDEENTINLPQTVTGSSDQWNDRQSVQYLSSNSLENNGNYNKNVSHEETKVLKSTSLNQSHQVNLNFEEKELVENSGLDNLMLYNNCSPIGQNFSSGKCDSSLLETNLSKNDSQLCENSVKTFLKNSNCFASVKYNSGNLSANMMFPTHSLLNTSGNSEHQKIGSSKDFIATNVASNDCCPEYNKKSMLKSPTAVIDSEIGDESIILKDESLTGEILNIKSDFGKKNKDLNHYVGKTGITGANTKTDKSLITGFVEDKEFVASEKCLDQNSLKCLDSFTSKPGNGYKKRKLLENLTVTYGPAKWQKTVKSPDLSNVSSESSNDDSLHHFDFFSLEKENGVSSSEQKSSCGYYQGLTIDCIRKPYPTCKRKYSLSMNRKLQVAFLSKKTKRKNQAKHASKNNKIKILGLSLLHEATLANLTEKKSSNEVDLGETDSEFEDVLSKMALYSSPETDSLDSLPPQPFSPEGLSQSISSSEYCNKKEFSNLEMETSELSYLCDIDNSERLLTEKCNIDGFSNFDDQHFSKTDCCKKAVVKLNRLSEDEIEKYKREKQNIKTEQENSPPDLEPQTISQYPKYGSCRNEKNHIVKSHINPTEVSSCNSKYGDLDSLSEPTLSITADKINNVQLLKSGENQVGDKVMEISMSKHLTNDKVNINPVYLKETESLPAKDYVCEPVQHNLICASDDKVYTSKLLPPSKKHVTDTAIKLNLNQANNQNAFCSNPDDIPEKPKELGGRKLSIESTQLSELAEFSSDFGSDNIAKWRGIICSAGVDFVNSKDILDKIDRDRQLQFSIVEDAHVIITPCKPAPLCKTIRYWKNSRQIYKHSSVKERKKIDIKKQEQIEFKCIQKFQQKFYSVKPNKSVSFNGQYSEKMSSSSKASRTCVNEMKSNIDENSLICDISRDDTEDDVIGPSPPDVTPSNRNIKHILRETSRDDTEDDVIGPSPPGVTPSNRNIKDILRESSRDDTADDVIGPSPPGVTPSNRNINHRLQNRLFSSQPGLLTSSLLSSQQTLHSTPLTKVRNNNLVLPACTPINHLKKEAPLSRLEAVNSRKGELSIELQQYSTPVQKRNVSQIDGPTPKNSFGFQISQQNFHDAKALHEVQNMTVLSMELLADSRGDLLSDPEVDAIKAVFYTIHNDMNDTDITGVIVVDAESTKIQEESREKSKQSAHLLTCNNQNPSTSTGSSPVSESHKPSTSSDTTGSTLVSESFKPSTSTDTTDRTPCLKDTVKSDQLSSKLQKYTSFSGVHLNQTLLQKSGIDDNLQVAYVETEIGLFNAFKDLITRLDPDLLVGYEIQKTSWGYLLQRAAQVGIDLCSQISRIPEEKRGSHFSAEKDEYGADSMSEIHIVGRIVLNLWRVMRHEVTLNIYTFENVMFHVLHQRTPKYSFRNLNSWYNKKTHNHRWRVINYYITRVRANLQIMEQIDLVGRTSEFARVFGIEFYHVLSRGSQYRVESMMLRLAKPMNFIAVSPNVHQRARMRAPECIPLTLEPESRFYHDPVVVVDFQSLYPSIMIAYNYCFSTCVGRISLLEKAHEGAIEFGCTHLKIPPSVLKKIQDDVTVSPNGVVFVKQSVRKGIISAMVEDILNTRIMVKKAMKDCKKDKTLHRLLHARQLGLKLIANVTYGYTGANFSGRMPCIEVGDSIVRKARETLERSIKLVEDTPKWGAKVLYGDTDSMFILLKGRSKDDAFKIGYDICDAVTALHPSPIKLKFEKVYLPCVLQTKKRYVGFSYETPDQKEPIFDAKGIETVRRDACPAVAKILERSIKVLFTTRDVSQVKQYVQNQCCKIMEEKVSMLDLVFAKEFRGMSGYKPGACVPALEISRKMLQHDRRSEPSVGERVPYVIVYGSPGLPLIQLVKQPFELLTDPSLRINVTYYITKQILPPVGRILSLLGIDVFSWYIDMPKIIRVVPHSVMPAENRKGTISQYFSSSNCPVCEKATNQNICDICIQDPQTVTTVLNSRIRKWEKAHYRMLEICNCCMGAQDEKQHCVSLDCPILYRLNLALKDSHKGTHFRDIINKCFEF
ncbi:DNA polymerase zeta catalytic subunit-like [Mytilus trossulus]|uniref:DNA polymerase zeta catalytic subunit-like n=1 Tax=Mytilus trossulus TaxID=6551 RepID=UPI0030064F7C